MYVLFINKITGHQLQIYNEQANCVLKNGGTDEIHHSRTMGSRSILMGSNRRPLDISNEQ